ncbi:P2RX4 [Branchiostoma lanceolatum]|uniref:P2X purinoceptor n=1 Tax=Branchiostoma lanceolatum TaxID=7740 RepID=A0A8J9VEV2_BRALA|nr:P2RX4 [Branchiostoma lanceolatum]
MADGPSFCQRVVQVVFEYDTPRIVHIKNKKVGLINRLIQLGIIGYIIGWVFVYKKGYQDFGDIVSSVSTKLKGVAYPNRTDIGDLNRVWDIAGLVVPPQQRDGFFIMTNMIITPDQHQTTCAEAPWIGGNVSCTDTDTSNCPAGHVELTGNGMFTGKCANFSSEVQTCEIQGWCPVEQQDNPPSPAVLEDAKEFTILLKNTISFPLFNFTKRNILDDYDPGYLKNCRFNNSDPVDKYCPIIRLDTMVKEANQNFTALAEQGGIIGISITWDCNLDYSSSYCLPKYSFTRLDKADSKVSPGYNFRYARYYRENGTDYRTLIKAYGIRFDVVVSGKAGKFNIIPLTMNIGSGLALLGVATILCDIVVLYLLKKRLFYQEKKYMMVDDDDDLRLFAKPTKPGKLSGKYEQLEEDQTVNHHRNEQNYGS